MGPPGPVTGFPSPFTTTTTITTTFAAVTTTTTTTAPAAAAATTTTTTNNNNNNSNNKNNSNFAVDVAVRLFEEVVSSQARSLPTLLTPKITSCHMSVPYFLYRTPMSDTLAFQNKVRPTHCATRFTTYTRYMYCCNNTGTDRQNFKILVLNF